MLPGKNCGIKIMFLMKECSGLWPHPERSGLPSVCLAHLDPDEINILAWGNYFLFGYHYLPIYEQYLCT